ncbi:hypothetical protein [Halomonas piscis]|uniref:hypothetical protein n=1 Tax=Halomonas piscis TaxID=3031727 RepID=UPI0028993035|nr:hypothetical protein [Halomonas piscis]
MSLNLSHLPKRKGIGLVRRLLPDIEAALYEGGALKDIHGVLQSDHGLTITFNSFKVALHRARKEKGREVMTAPGAKAGKERRLGTDPVGNEPEAPQQPQTTASKKKRGIIGPEDFRPRPGIEEEIERIASKKYD